MKLWHQLIREYEKAKNAIHSHTAKNGGALPATKVMKHMNSRSMAGLYLKVSGDKALEAFDSAASNVPGYTELWSESRKLIEQAINEAKEHSEN